MTRTSLLSWARFRGNWFPVLGITALSAILFAYGVGVGLYKWPPFDLIREAKTVVIQFWPTKVPEYRGEQELLQYALTDPVAESDLYHPPITSLADIREANKRIFMLRDGFENAYQDIQVSYPEQIDRPPDTKPVTKVDFSYQGHEYKAFAYGELPTACDLTAAASLIIPGSGRNQSYEIVAENRNNYHHGILDAVTSWGGNTYTFIKPNESHLSWHDGAGNKLNGSFIFNWHLNREGSYSVTYLVQALAITKWMRSCFGETLIAGLSQGGGQLYLPQCRVSQQLRLLHRVTQ